MKEVTVSAEFMQEVQQTAAVMLEVQARILTAVTRLERETGMEGPHVPIAHALHTAAVDLAAQWQDLDDSLSCISL